MSRPRRSKSFSTLGPQDPAIAESFHELPPYQHAIDSLSNLFYDLHSIPELSELKEAFLKDLHTLQWGYRQLVSEEVGAGKKASNLGKKRSGGVWSIKDTISSSGTILSEKYQQSEFPNINLNSSTKTVRTLRIRNIGDEDFVVKRKPLPERGRGNIYNYKPGGVEIGIPGPSGYNADKSVLDNYIAYYKARPSQSTIEKGALDTLPLSDKHGRNQEFRKPESVAGNIQNGQPAVERYGHYSSRSLNIRDIPAGEQSSDVQPTPRRTYYGNINIIVDNDINRDALQNNISNSAPVKEASGYRDPELFLPSDNIPTATTPPLAHPKPLRRIDTGNIIVDTKSIRTASNPNTYDSEEVSNQRNIKYDPKILNRNSTAQNSIITVRSVPPSPPYTPGSSTANDSFTSSRNRTRMSTPVHAKFTPLPYIPYTASILPAVVPSYKESRSDSDYTGSFKYRLDKLHSNYQAALLGIIAATDYLQNIANNFHDLYSPTILEINQYLSEQGRAYVMLGEAADRLEREQLVYWKAMQRLQSGMERDRVGGTGNSGGVDGQGEVEGDEK
ncbi:hypothetical protein RUND412_007700 [Rhizina undulata]